MRTTELMGASYCTQRVHAKVVVTESENMRAERCSANHMNIFLCCCGVGLCAPQATATGAGSTRGTHKSERHNGQRAPS